MSSEFLIVRGAREHNLKNVTVQIPKKQLVVFTGVSGSGKSSLAFDTLYAEGQRRYVESLSSYARQFLGQMEKPKYDTIRGLSPTIAIEQKAASSNPRSTVGTVTEIHDYLRVLFARVGVQHCTKCDRAVGGQSSQQIVDAIMAMPEGTKLQVLSPLERQRKGEHKERIEDARQRGFARMRIDGRIWDLADGAPSLDKKSKHDVELVVDRIVLKPTVRPRLSDSIETALKEGDGLVLIATADGDRFFSERNSCPNCSISFDALTPQVFSFNSPQGFCSACNGLGSRPEMDPDLVVPNPTLSIRDGAVAPWAGPLSRGEGWTAQAVHALAHSFDINLDIPWNKLSQADRDLVLFGSAAAPRRGGGATSERRDRRGRTRTWEGLVHQLMRRFKTTESEEMKRYYMRFFSDKPCLDCGGKRLRKESRAVRVLGTSIVDLAGQTIASAHAWLHDAPFKGTDAQIASELCKEILARLGFLIDVGLGYLTLDRAAATLSGGESQRIRLASQIGSELTGVVYILDEPSIGLHQRDNGRLVATLKRLRDIGNSVIVVEHDEETIRDADWVIDFGPGAGELGGEVVAEGTPTEIAANANSLTGAFLSGRRKIQMAGPSGKQERRPGNGHFFEVRGATEHNLKNIDVRFPLGTFTVVTGVSGAGKSTLVNRILYPALARALNDSREHVGAHTRVDGIKHVDKVINIDQQPIGRTPRSNAATYTKVWDAIRNVYASTSEARAFGYEAGRFSFNVKGGRCEACGGDGQRRIEMHFLPDVYVTCDACNGSRFNEATLRVRFKGKNIAETLAMSVREAMSQFEVHREIIRPLRTLHDVGLDYVKLGQPSPTLSGGEAQRIKLARELSRVGTGRTAYILDEPTTGLHFADVEKLLVVLGRLVDAGNTVIVIEHNLDVIKCADWVIDIGPEGGAAGGRVIAEGVPEHVARVKESFTGQYLAGMMG